MVIEESGSTVNEARYRTTWVGAEGMNPQTDQIKIEQINICKWSPLYRLSSDKKFILEKYGRTVESREYYLTRSHH